MRARLLLLVGLLLALGTGCELHLAGTRDVLLSYALAGAPTESGEEDLVGKVRERLGAADVIADVGGEAGALTVRLDEEGEVEASDLLAWTGGLALTPLAPKDGSGDGSGVDCGAPSWAEQAWSEDVSRGALEVAWHTEDGCRTRRVVWPPKMTVDARAARARGSTLVVPLSTAEEAELVELRESQAPLAVVLGRKLLATKDPASLTRTDALLVPMAGRIHAYADAERTARLLETPRLPRLPAPTRASLPPDVPLALSTLLLPVLVSGAWLFFVRRFDRAQPEPMWLVVLTFLLGALSAFPAGLVEWGWDALSPYTNPLLLTFGGSARALPLSIVAFAVTIGLTEEGAKLLATRALATKRREFDEPVDGIVYAAAAALGFAAIENVRYFGAGRAHGALVVSRAFTSVPAHLFFGSLWGYALGRRLVRKDAPAWPLFLLAALLHGAFDACLATEGGMLGALAINALSAALFVLFVRRALSYGSVAGAPAATGPRALFPVGSRRAFASYVTLLFASSTVVFMLGVVWEEWRPGVLFGIVSASALAVVGWAARGVAGTLPLDVAVDDHGVTFAGATVPYAEIVRLERRGARWLHVVGRARTLALGPARGETLDRIGAAVDDRQAAAYGQVAEQQALPLSVEENHAE